MEAKFETSFEVIAAKNIGRKYVVELYSKWEYQYSSIDYTKNTEWFFENEEEQIKFLQEAIKNSIDVYSRNRLWEGGK